MTNVKLLGCQAYSISQYKNLRSKLLKCCAEIYFNKQCLNKKVIPKHASIRTANTSPASQVTAKEVQVIRIKDEIKFLFKKKVTMR